MKWLNLGESVSGSFKLDMTDVKKIGRDAAIAGLSTVLSVLANNLGGLDMGPYTVILVPVIHSAINTALRFLKSNETVVTPVKE